MRIVPLIANKIALPMQSSANRAASSASFGALPSDTVSFTGKKDKEAKLPKYYKKKKIAYEPTEKGKAFEKALRKYLKSGSTKNAQNLSLAYSSLKSETSNGMDDGTLKERSIYMFTTLVEAVNKASESPEKHKKIMRWLRCFERTYEDKEIKKFFKKPIKFYLSDEYNIKSRGLKLCLEDFGAIQYDY